MSVVTPGAVFLGTPQMVPTSAIPRPRGHNLRWAIIAVICVLTLANYLDRGNLSVAAPLIMKDLGISNTMMGVMLSAFVWPYAIMNLPVGWLIDRFGARLLLTFAAGLWSLVAVLTGFASTIGQFLGLRVALGVSEAPLFPSALKATNAWFPDHEKAAAISVYIAATQVGLAIAPPIATALMLAFGWPAMFVIIGLFGFVAVFAWIAVYREPGSHAWLSREELTYIRAGQTSRVLTTEAERPASIREWSRLFAHVPMWIMIIGAFCLQYTFWFYISWLPTYLERAQHFTISRAGYLSALPFVAGAVGVMTGGRISDWLVLRGVVTFTARRVVVATGALLTAVAMIVTLYSPSPSFAVALLTVGMFTYSLTSGCYWALATDVLATPRFVASVGSIQNFGGFLGGACAPIVTGIVVDRFGGFDVAILVTGVLALVSATLYGLLLRRRIPL
jgi:MFS family permease